MTVLAQRMPPLNSVLNTSGSFFDDKMAVVNASLRGDIRGIALRLLLDPARKPVFLHDNSVPSLQALLDPKRGRLAPSISLIPSSPRTSSRFLRGLDTRNGIRK